MELVDVNMKVPKEMKEVKDFLVKLIEDIKMKKSTSEIIAGSLAGLMLAIEGFDKLGDEVKSKESYNLYALMIADMVKAFMAKPPEVPVTPTVG